MKQWVQHILRFWMVSGFGVLYVSILQPRIGTTMFLVGSILFVAIAFIWSIATYHYREELE